MHAVYSINLIIFGLYLLSLVIDRQLGHSFPRQLIGTFLFLLVGLNWVFVVQKLFKTGFDRGTLILLTVVLSVLVLPVLVYISYLRGYVLTEQNVLYLTGIALLVPLVLIHIKDLRERTVAFSLPSVDKVREELQRNEALLVAFILYGGVMAINLLLYRFIPESDGYTYLKTTESLLTRQPPPELGGRPLFSILAATYAHITQISLFVLFKYLIPLGLSVLVIVNYLFLRDRGINGRLVPFLSVIPLAVPVVVMEFLIPRPQSIILLLVPIVLYFYYRAITTRNVWYMVINLFISLVSIKYHELGLFLVALSLPMLLLYFWNDIKKNPTFATGLILYGIVGLYPYLVQSDLAGLVSFYTKLTTDRLADGQFRWWFVSSYVNVDGNSVGWPGYTWIFYYGYNLGLLVPIVVGLGLWRFKINSKKLIPFSPFIGLGILFLLVAEVLPRFGFSFLPDRAWLLLMLSIQFLVLIITAKIVKDTFWQKSLLVLWLFSVMASFYITHAKQGWITQPGYSAAQWINQNTESDAIIITQPGNNPLANYYIHRHYYIPTTKKEEVLSRIDEVLKNPLVAQQNYVDLLKKKAQHQRSLRDQLDTVFTTSPTSELEELNSQILASLSSYIDTQSKLYELSQTRVADEKSPIYLMYSADKSKGLYAQREWWKLSNWEDFDTQAVDARYNRVYSQEGVTIWKVK